MGCFECNTFAMSFNEHILPVSFSFLFFAISMKFFLKIIFSEELNAKRKSIKLLSLILIYSIGLYICLELSPIEILSPHINTMRM